MVLVDYSITDTYTQVSEPRHRLAAGSHPQGLERVAITGPHCPSSQSGLEPSFPSGVATCWCRTAVGGWGVSEAAAEASRGSGAVCDP